ncbi:hypothetical protein V8F33_008690 [Rhypophila sp. PSN 637]
MTGQGLAWPFWDPIIPLLARSLRSMIFHNCGIRDWVRSDYVLSRYLSPCIALQTFIIVCTYNSDGDDYFYQNSTWMDQSSIYATRNGRYGPHHLVPGLVPVDFGSYTDTGPPGDEQQRLFDKVIDGLAKEADRRSRADRNPSKYTRAHVLLLQWEHSDLVALPGQVKHLGEVFEVDYGFQVEHFTIPVKGSDIQLWQKLQKWVGAYDHDEALLIVYYGGHGTRYSIYRHQHLGRGLRLCNQVRSYNEKTASSVLWNPCHDFVQKASADKLFILDCCYASTGIIDEQFPISPRGASETLCATGLDTFAYAGASSFTVALAARLKNMEKHGPFSVSTLHASMLTWHTIPLGLDYTRFLGPSHGKIFVEEIPRDDTPRPTPVHSILSPIRNASSIHLCPLPATTKRQQATSTKPTPEQTINIQLYIPDTLDAADARAAQQWLRSCPLPTKCVKVTSNQGSEQGEISEPNAHQLITVRSKEAADAVDSSQSSIVLTVKLSAKLRSLTLADAII